MRTKRIAFLFFFAALALAKTSHAVGPAVRGSCVYSADVSQGTVYPDEKANMLKPVEFLTSMAIDLDGAPNAYGPPGWPALDKESSAHHVGKISGPIVGYLTESDGRTPKVQGKHDLCPGYYISTTGFYNHDKTISDDNPRKYLDATKVNYVVRGRFASAHNANLGDLIAVYSKKTRKSVFGIIGDSGNPCDCEGSLALLRALGYPVKNIQEDGVDEKEFLIRYYPHSNLHKHFFRNQKQIDNQANALGLSKEFAAH